jgi:hypothetical protein
MRAVAQKIPGRAPAASRRPPCERIFLVVDGGGSAEDERARSTNLRTPRERRARGWDRADAVQWRAGTTRRGALCRAGAARAARGDQKPRTQVGAAAAVLSL